MIAATDSWWGRRWIAAAAAAMAAGLIALATLATLGVFTIQSLGDTDVTFSTDPQAVDEWETQVAPALEDLNGLGDLPGLRAADPGRVQPCSVDSGELFDVSAGRTWDAETPGPDIGD